MDENGWYPAEAHDHPQAAAGASLVRPERKPARDLLELIPTSLVRDSTFIAQCSLANRLSNGCSPVVFKKLLGIQHE